MKWNIWESGLIKDDIASQWGKDGAGAVGLSGEKIKLDPFTLLKKNQLQNELKP